MRPIGNENKPLSGPFCILVLLNTDSVGTMEFYFGGISLEVISKTLGRVSHHFPVVTPQHANLSIDLYSSFHSFHVAHRK